MAKKKILSMDQLTANAEKVLKGKKQNHDGKMLFEKTLKAAVKQRGSK
ncbi:MAG: hypothetical protein ABIR78_00825 [Ferruginibacter sp.]